MCGRFVQLSEPKELEQHYGKRLVPKYRGPNYNVAPSQSIPVVTGNGIIDMRFGLVPQWAKSLATGYTMINAKAETLLEKPTYKGLLRHSRCLVPASGFYEWKKLSTGKQPYYFSLKHQDLFSFAGLYTSRKDSEGHELFSFTIITTEPNRLVREVHDRMPVILTADEEKLWLETPDEDAESLLALLDAYPASAMQSYRVAQDVGSVTNNSVELIKPID